MPSEKVARILRSKSNFDDEEIGKMTDLEAWNWVYQNKSPTSPPDKRLQVCFTGFLPREKKWLWDLADEAGMKVVKSVTKNLSYLCVGKNPGPSKLDNAINQKTTILNEQEFLNMIEVGEIPDNIDDTDSIKQGVQVEPEEYICFPSEEIDKEYYEAFSWALPHAFSDPLNFCRFEQGDTLYDTSKAYLSPWSEALKHIQYSIQIVYPPRTTQTKTDEEYESVFKSNWERSVELDLLTFENREISSKKRIYTTQGTLYTVLWKGDLRLLDEKEFTPPLGAKALRIETAELSEKIFTELKNNYSFTEAFVMPYDKSNPILRSKFLKILECLKNQKNQATVIYKRPNIIAGNEFVPTLQLAYFLVVSDNESLLLETVKKAVYRPAKNKKTEKDNFRINAHGLLLINK